MEHAQAQASALRADGLLDVGTLAALDRWVQGALLAEAQRRAADVAQLAEPSSHAIPGGTPIFVPGSARPIQPPASGAPERQAKKKSDGGLGAVLLVAIGGAVIADW